MPLNLRPHNYVPSKDQPGVMVLQKHTPYVRYIAGTPEGEDHRYPIIAQSGVLWTDGGDRIPWDDVPDWFWAEARKTSEEKRKQIGLVLPEEGEPVEQVEEEQISTVQEDKPLTLVDAVYELDPSNDGHWTKKGMPHLKVLEAVLGRFVSRAEVDQVAQGFVRPKET
tara:strand:+ start:133 stop:633 length:501 start_codon:yes stop_codon:yes gene_type:complete